MNTRPLTELQYKTYLMIKDRHKGNPIIGAEIMTFLNIKDKNKKTGANMRAIINALRDKGYAICANERGYYYPQTPGELTEYIDQFQNRIDQQQMACNELKNKVKNWIELIAAKKSKISNQPVQEQLLKINRAY